MPTAAGQLTEGLTDAQRAAVEHVEGPLLVLAGPGSGKTTVVTRRIAHLVHQGIPAWQILALTFTNKAAEEMRNRVDALVPPDVPGRRGLTVSTFHAFCARVLRQYAPALGLSPRFTIYDTADQRDAIKQALRAADLSERNFTPAAVSTAISGAKNRLLDAEAYAAEASDFYARSMARAYTEYERILRRNDAMDFDDLLLSTARLLRTQDAERAELQERYQYILVDEYQDTNHAQFVIASALAEAHRNLCVVGDPDQSIYGWRGADIRNILEFEHLYAEATTIPLGQNFRSTAHIVAAADQLIRHNVQRKHKTLSTELGEGEKPVIVACPDERHEARHIVDECKRRNEDDDVPWKEMAVLYRINALSRVLEDAFRDAQIPYVIARGTAFYDRKEIKDALAYMRVIANPNDEVALRRIINTPTRGIGRTTLDALARYAQRHGLRLADAVGQAASVDGLTARAVTAIGKFAAILGGWQRAIDGDAPAEGTLLPTEALQSGLAELVGRVVKESGLERLYAKSRAEEDLERLENLGELVSAAAQFVAPAPDDNPGATPGDTSAEERGPATVREQLEAYLEGVALVSDADVVDPRNGAVTLMTLHAAKGLEFDVVTMAGLEDGLLPHMRAVESPDELEEERRLCFVGMTRARRHLLMTRAGVRTHRGIRERTIESTFIGELPSESIVTLDQTDAWDAYEDPYESRWSAPGAGASEYREGVVVRHPSFGVGRVMNVSRRAAGASVRVRFETVGVKTLILEYANLEVVG